MNIYRIEIDRTLCSGFGSCVRDLPGQFALDRSGVVTLLSEDTDDDRVLDAAAGCPMGAIAVFETTTADRAA